ncbi:MAG: flagellar biosynthesis protein FlhB [Myxococcales bacterium]|nr:MAG: flagellar biosynthesis protein FlhB [Myxococcales bacterium]
MAEDQFERTEPATPRKRQKFRDRGQVAKSREVSGVLLLLGALGYFYFAGDSFVEGMRLFQSENFRLAIEGTLDIARLADIFAFNVTLFFKLLVPYFLMVIALVFLGNIVQTGWLMTAHPLIPDWTRVDPVAKFQQIFLSARLFTEAAVNLLKVALLAVIVYLVIDDRFAELPGLFYMEPLQVGVTIIDGILDILMKTAIAFIVVALIDYLFQWWRHERDLRMSKQELRDELKEMEGDPFQKGQMRQRMREISMNKIIQSVPTANVVVTNPTHLAVALRYEPGEDEAPVVVAKGQGFWAERIKEVARENGVDVVEDKLLARALYKSVRVGREVPRHLYRAVAELLAHVHGLQQKLHGRRPASRRPAAQTG